MLLMKLFRFVSVTGPRSADRELVSKLIRNHFSNDNFIN